MELIVSNTKLPPEKDILMFFKSCPNQWLNSLSFHTTFLGSRGLFTRGQMRIFIQTQHPVRRLVTGTSGRCRWTTGESLPQAALLGDPLSAWSPERAEHRPCQAAGPRRGSSGHRPTSLSPATETFHRLATEHLPRFSDPFSSQVSLLLQVTHAQLSSALLLRS